MERDIRFGLIGCGMIAGFHASAIKEIEGAILTAVYDARKESAEQFAKTHGGKVFDDLQEMLSSSEMDAVCICTPSGLHATQAIQACREGLHVLVEKPMALSVEEAEEVILAARENNVKLGVVSQLRFSEDIRRVKKAVEDGNFGKMIMGNLSMKYYRSKEYYENGGWRGTWKMDGGGALMNQGIHGIDLLRYLMGDVSKVCGTISTRVHAIEVEDTAAAAVEFQSGALGTITASTCANPGKPRCIEMCGENGSVYLEEDKIIEWNLKETQAISVHEEKNGAASDPKAISSQGHIWQITDFIRAIKEDGTPLSDGLEGKKTVELILAIYTSSRQQRIVKLEQ